MTKVVPQDMLALANRLADASGAIIRTYFRQAIAVDIKDDLSPVTRADREVEEALRRVLKTERPDDGFFGEETGGFEGSNGLTWAIDPIDGTKAFVCGKPLFGTLIALLEGDTPVLGVIDQPITGERWLGARGCESTLGGATISTRTVSALREARLGATSPGLFSTGQMASFRALSEACAVTTWGGDCYNYALIANGCLDLVAEAGLKLYDYAALIPVIEGAGGVITGWQGETPSRHHDGRILAAATPALHAAALAILSRLD